MSRENQLAKNTLIYFIGSFGSKILTFLLLPVYSNYLSQSQYGNYDLINTIIQILYPLITLMLDNAMYVYLISTKEKKRQEDLIAYAIRTLLINSIIAVVICVIINNVYPVQYMRWAVLWLLSYSAYNVWSQICRGFSQSKLFSATGVVVTTITLMGSIIGLIVLKLDYKVLMISNTLALASAVLIFESRIHALKYAFKGTPNKALKKELIRYTIPLLPNQVSWWFINVSDRLMLAYLWGTSTNGLYAMACKIPALLSILHSIFSMAWSDMILSAKNIKTIEKDTEKIYNAYIQISIGVAIILICSNKLIFKYIIAGNFSDGYKYTYFLYVANVFSAMAASLGAYYGYFRKSLNVGISTIVAAIVNFGINAIFMKKYGIQVASVSTLLSFIVMWIIRMMGLRGLINIKVHGYTKMLLLLLIPLYFVNYIEGFWNNITLIAVGCVMAIAINYKNIKFIIKEAQIILRKRKNQST